MKSIAIPRLTTFNLLISISVLFAEISFSGCGDDGCWRRIKISTSDEVTSLYDVWGTSSGELVLGGDQIVKYDGKEFEIQDTQGDDNLSIHGISGNSESNVYAVGRKVMKSDGVSWSQVNDLDFGTLSDVWVSNDGMVHAVGSGVYGVDERARLFLFNGEQWLDLRKNDIEADIESVWGIDDQNVFAAGSADTATGYRSVILYYDGIEWSEVDTNWRAQLKSIWGTSRDDVYAVGWLGKMLHFDGETWEEIYLANGLTLESVWGRSPDDIFVAENDTGKIYHFDGQRWSSKKICSNCLIESIWGTDDGKVYAVGTFFIDYQFRGAVFENTCD